MTNKQTTLNKKITVGLILCWVFGILFGLIGIISVFSEPIPGIVMLTMAAVLLPPINKLVDEKWKFHLSRGIKIVVIIVGFIIFGATIDTSNTEKKQNNQTQIQQKQKQTISNTEQKKDEIKQTELHKTANNEESVKTEKTVITTTPTVSNQVQAPTKTENKPLPSLSETVSQKNAVAKAKSYLVYSAFSHDGLIAQLEYEQFSHADAVYGSDNSGADWNEQAAKKAKSYMEYSAFSRNGLIAQLKYDKFTQDQAVY